MKLIRLYEHYTKLLFIRLTRWWNNNIISADPIHDFNDHLADMLEDPFLTDDDVDYFCRLWYGRVDESEIRRAMRLFNDNRNLGV